EMCLLRTPLPTSPSRATRGPLPLPPLKRAERGSDAMCHTDRYALRRLGPDVIGRVDVTWIPQHPAVRTGIARGLGLLADLVGAEILAAEGVVGKGLQPRPVLRRLGGCPPFALFERLVDDLVGMLDRVAVAGNAELETRRIEHRRDHVDHLGKIL